MNGAHRSSRVSLTWNGLVLIAPSEMTPETQALLRELPPPRPEGETLDLTLEGADDSFITVRVIGKGRD